MCNVVPCASTESPKRAEVAFLLTSEPEEIPTTQATPRSAPSSAPASRASTPPSRNSAPPSAPRSTPRSVPPSVPPSVPRSAAPSAPVTSAPQPTSTTSHFGDIQRSTTRQDLKAT
ncbi:hypothetical protein PAXINDRAFT_102955 [Paxillus involutus ATCC 200175]|uniref:Uncharacterized protein n=1 Tax=Paxillus involutus ATCC 200175 TaxID=664439 RepID=A0A0C9T8I1_PAXIN|nr:hypothetical protein PAXINDRAFT_102955 [Paxillus involutus ATCC 200175]